MRKLLLLGTLRGVRKITEKFLISSGKRPQKSYYRDNRIVAAIDPGGKFSGI